MDDASTYVLVGGRSSRMGCDKALLPVGGLNLLQMTLAKAREVTPKTVIVGGRERYGQYGAVIEDIIPGCGPLSGIHAALSTTASEWNLILSVDMPFMSSGFLRWLLLQTASAQHELAIVPRAQGRTQPLCSVFRRGALGEIERALHVGEYKVDRLFSILPTRFVLESEWSASGVAPDIFRNVNTPEEYDVVVSLVEETGKVSSRGTAS